MTDKQRRVKIREYGAQQLEALGFPSSLEFELDDGSVITLKHPWLWDDKTVAAYEAARADDRIPEYNMRIARAALGEEEHARFIAGGGSSNQIVLAIELMKRKRAELADGESDDDPKG
jgi:hypothetical protein